MVAARLKAAGTIALGLLVAAAGLVVFTLSGVEAGPAAEVLDSARRAFTAGLSVVGCTGAAIVLTVAVITFLFLRGPSGQAGAEQPRGS